ncbi:MAG: hypothetical protein QOG40_677 [Solirubrobacteraceae bacterium]|nr:hypothetical protein [Solirubrobacteraceae bacterium]
MTMADVNTGRPFTGIDTPTHVKGISEGNARGNYEKMPGHNPDGTSTARRSTGIRPEGEEPIDPSMPNLPPA